MKQQMSYDQFKRMVERFDEEQAKKFKNSGLKPPKLKVKDTTCTVNANISPAIYEALKTASELTGMTQRALLERSLTMSLDKIVHSHTKTVSFWKR